MEEFKKEVKNNIDKAVRDLFSDKDKYHCLDVDAVSDAVTRFILERENFETINETNQYDAYYRFLGKAVAMTQGWKLNSAPDVKLPSQTKANLEHYITRTYGVPSQPGQTDTAPSTRAKL